MRVTDKDIEALNELLGPTVADYRSLRHHRQLRAPAPRRNRIAPVHIAAVAASVLVAVVAISLVATGPDGPPDPQAQPRIATKSTLPSRPGTRPDRLSTPRMSIEVSRLTLPRRPARPKG